MIDPQNLRKLFKIIFEEIWSHKIKFLTGLLYNIQEFKHMSKVLT